MVMKAGFSIVGLNLFTKIGKEFLKLLRKYFPKENKFNKLFNKNNIKISYGCTRNMQQIIKAHNAKNYKWKQHN